MKFEISKRVRVSRFLALAICGWVVAISQLQQGQADDTQAIINALIFHAPFDGSEDARLAPGDRRIYTGDTSARKNAQPGNSSGAAKIAVAAGRYGDALRFSDKQDKVLFFPGNCVHYRRGDWSGTVSVWLRLDPNKDLKPGYCDPIQITDKTWNDSAFFVDFDKDLPRDFRLGVFADQAFWNPHKIEWEKLPIDQRPMVTVKNPPFSSNKWSHVLFTFENINTADGKEASATLYIDALPRGTLRRPLRFTWDPEKVAMMLGLSYIGDMDDLAMFNRALSPAEVKMVYELPSGIGGLANRK